MFHIGIEISGNTTDCVLIDPAAPGAAVAYRLAKELSAKAGPADRVLAGLRIQVIRALGQDQQELWRKFLMISHELLHRPGHPRPAGYRKRLGSGSHARDALTEGVVSLLTEIVWSEVLPRVRPASRAAIQGEHACEPSPRAGEMPRLAYDRYASMAEVMRLLHVAGSALNVFAVFFLGEVEKVTGPVSLAVLGTPRAPLLAGEVAALVARLSAVPVVERQLLRISLFADAPQEQIERLLTEPGADILAVWTADGTSAGAGSKVGTPSQAGPPSGTGTPGVPAGLPPRSEGDPAGGWTIRWFMTRSSRRGRPSFSSSWAGRSRRWPAGTRCWHPGMRC